MAIINIINQENLSFELIYHFKVGHRTFLSQLDHLKRFICSQNEKRNFSLKIRNISHMSSLHFLPIDFRRPMQLKGWYWVTSTGCWADFNSSLERWSRDGVFVCLSEVSRHIRPQNDHMNKFGVIDNRERISHIFFAIQAAAILRKSTQSQTTAHTPYSTRNVWEVIYMLAGCCRRLAYLWSAPPVMDFAFCKVQYTVSKQQDPPSCTWLTW